MSLAVETLLTTSQDEKEAQRKLDHKREIDRKKAAQQEEGHKRELQQRQDAERQREKDRAAAAEEAKKAAQKQTMEKRKLEQQKKDQLRGPQRTANDLVSPSGTTFFYHKLTVQAHALQQEKTQAPATTHRGDTGAARPPSRLNSILDISRTLNSFPVPNPAKPPPKRFFEPDMDDESTRVIRTQPGQSFQQNESKRRRTEEEASEAPIRPTMAPPLRQSNIRKVLIFVM